MWTVAEHVLFVGQESSQSGLLFWVFLLGFAALAIVALEMFVPSGGVLALLAGACVIGSIIAAFVHGSMTGLLALGVYGVLGPIVGVFVFRWWMHSPLAKHFVLASDVSRERAPSDFEQDEAPPDDDDGNGHASTFNESLRVLVGEEGEAVTPLRPVGTVLIHGERLEALSEVGSIERGARVIVTDAYDNQLKVQEKR